MKEKKYLHIIGFLLYTLFLMPACDKEARESEESGSILLGVEKNEVLYTKAGEPIEDEVLGVYFINTATSDTTKQFENYKEEVEGQRILLPAATYDIRISSATLDEPAWDTPVYYADTTLTLKAGEIASAALECKITNTKVTVDFTQNVANYFSYYEAVVAGKSGELTFIMDETRAGFYSTDKFTVTLNLTNKNNGINFQFIKVFPDIQPRYHYKLKFDTTDSGDEAAGGNIDVTIDEELEEVEYTIRLPKYTQLQDMPKAPTTKVETRLVGESDDAENSTLIFKRVEGVKVVDKQQLIISTQTGLKNLYINLSQSFTEESLPEIFDWFTVSDNIKNTLQISGSFNSENTIYTLDLKDMINNYLKANQTSSRVYSITLSAVDVYQQEVQQVLSYTVTPDLDLMTYPVDENEVWNKHATIRGFSDPTGTNIYFKYGKSNEPESSWSSVTPTMDNTGNVTAIITNLTSETSYSFRLYGTLNGTEEQGDIYTFTTDNEQQFPNAGFEDWQTVSSPYLIFKLGDDKFWDSGNEGGSTLGKNPTTPDGDIYNKRGAGERSAKLKSQHISFLGIGKFAAGNLFAGDYIDTNTSTMTGTIDFGRKFTNRPSKLKGWYKYEQGTIDYSETSMAPKNTPDSAHIYIALTTWSAPLRVDNSNHATLFNVNDPGIIAYGELLKGESTPGDELIEFEIELDYRYYDRKPTYIVVVCSASKYGDYFTGSTKSTMWLDDFELIYDSVLENK